MRVEMVDDVNRKRPAPSEPTDGLDQAKRQRVAASAPSPVTQNPIPTAPPLPAGPVSWRQLFTLNPEGSTVNFDVQAFRDPDQLVRILVPVLQSVDQVKLGHALNVRIHLSSSLSTTVAVEGIPTGFVMFALSIYKIYSCKLLASTQKESEHLLIRV